MKRFVMTISDKGGSGKSVMARLLADWYASKGVKVLLVDGDGEVGQLVRFHGARDEQGRLIQPQPKYEGVLQYSMHGGITDREKIANVLDIGAELVLVDFPAAGLQVLEQTNAAFGFLDDIKEEGYKPVFVNPITPFAASMRTVKNMVAIGGTDAEYIVFKNQMFADGAEDWVVWNGSEEDGIKPSGGKSELARVGGVELDLPKLRIGAMALIDEYRLTFAQAQEPEGKLPRYFRRGVQMWRRDVFSIFDSIAERLGGDVDTK